MQSIWYAWLTLLLGVLLLLPQIGVNALGTLTSGIIGWAIPIIIIIIGVLGLMKANKKK